MVGMTRAFQAGFDYSQKRSAQEILYPAVQLRAVPTRQIAYPGVQLQEIPFKASPIPGVSTSGDVSLARPITRFFAEQMGRLRITR